MAKTTIEWEITEAFAKFGFDGGDGPNFTGFVQAAIEGAGPYVCEASSYGSHNYMIFSIWEAGGGDEPVAVFDGYDLPAWDSLPEAIRDALVALNDGDSVKWEMPQ